MKVTTPISPSSLHFVDPEEVAQDPWALAREQGIYILSNREFSAALVDDDDNLIGALFTAFDGETFTFDVVVDPRFAGKGAGTKLAEYALDLFREIEDIEEEARLVVDVVSPQMARILQRLGLRQIDDRIMTL